MSSRTRSLNAWESALNGAITAGATTAAVDSATGLTEPLYLVIDPDSLTLREYIRVDGVSGNNLNSLTRGLTGSVSGAQAHSSGAVVRAVPVHQWIDDIFTDIEQNETDISTNAANFTAHDGGTDTADHPEVTPSVRGFSSAADKTKLDALDIAKQVTGGDAHTHGTGVAGSVRIGDIVPSALSSESDGFLLCDGQAVSQATYTDLFAAIGLTFGNPGGGNFNLPDMRQRFPLGKADAGTGSSLGDTGGAIDHTHSQPNHTHTMGTHSHSVNSHTHTMGTHSHAAGTLSVASHSHDMAAGSNDHNHTSTGQNVYHQSSMQTGSTAPAVLNSTASVDPGDTNAATPNTNAVDPGDTNSGGNDTTGSENPPFLALFYFIRAL